MLHLKAYGLSICQWLSLYKKFMENNSIQVKGLQKSFNQFSEDAAYLFSVMLFCFLKMR